MNINNHNQPSSSTSISSSLVQRHSSDSGPDPDPYDSEDSFEFDPYDFESDRLAYPNLPPGLGAFLPFAPVNRNINTGMGFTPNPTPSITINTTNIGIGSARNRLSLIEELSETSTTAGDSSAGSSTQVSPTSARVSIRSVSLSRSRSASVSSSSSSAPSITSTLSPLSPDTMAMTHALTLPPGLEGLMERTSIAIPVVSSGSGVHGLEELGETIQTERRNRENSDRVDEEQTSSTRLSNPPPPSLITPPPPLTNSQPEGFGLGFRRVDSRTSSSMYSVGDNIEEERGNGRSEGSRKRRSEDSDGVAGRMGSGEGKGKEKADEVAVSVHPVEEQPSETGHLTIGGSALTNARRPRMPRDGTVISELEFSSNEKTISFWLSFLAINISIFISGLSFMSLGTVLPTMARALQDEKGDFIWIGSAYALAMTCFIPLGALLSTMFGQKPVLLVCLVCFALGSALTGGAKNMAMMITGQTIQGIGGGGMISLTPTILCGLVSGSEQNRYQGILGLTWSIASAVAPVIGGAFASSGRTTWRWLFYLNLPLTCIAGVLVSIFLRENPSCRQQGSYVIKRARADWSQTAFLTLVSIFGCGLTTVGLAFGGVRFPWGSVQVLALLVVGLVVLISFGIFSVLGIHDIGLPGVKRLTGMFEILRNRTTVGGLACVAAHGIASIAFTFYMPIYFQAVLDHSSLRSAVDLLAGIIPMVLAAFLAGIIVTRTGYYRLPIYAGWVLMMVGFGLLSTLKEGPSTAQWVGFQVITGLGVGILFSAPGFSLVAPLPPNRVASALVFSNFIRAFAQTWGITAGSTILQNLFQISLPASSGFPLVDSHLSAFASIPILADLPDELKEQVHVAFAKSVAVIWQTMIGVCGVGLLGTLLIQKAKIHENKAGLVNGRCPMKDDRLDETPSTRDLEMGIRMEINERRDGG